MEPGERPRQARNLGKGEEPHTKAAFVLRLAGSPPVTFELLINTH